MEHKHKNLHKTSYKPVDLPTEPIDFAHVHCPSCSHEIPASDINIQDKLAKCNSCNAIFSIDQQIPEIVEKTEELQKPVGVESNYFGKELEIAIPQPVGVFYTILLCLLPILIFIAIGVFVKTGHEIAVIGGAISIFSFTYLLINTIRSRKKKVYFNVDENDLRIEWVPKKFVPLKFIPINQIEQIYTVRTHNGVALKAILNTQEGQTHSILVDYLTSVMIAKYTEQELEKHLGISNKKISNEIS